MTGRGGRVATLAVVLAVLPIDHRVTAALLVCGLRIALVVLDALRVRNRDFLPSGKNTSDEGKSEDDDVFHDSSVLFGAVEDILVSLSTPGVRLPQVADSKFSKTLFRLLLRRPEHVEIDVEVATESPCETGSIATPVLHGEARDPELPREDGGAQPSRARQRVRFHLREAVSFG